MFSNFLPGQNSDYLWKFYHIHIYFFYQKSGPVCLSYCIKKIYASFTELSTLNLVECKIYKQYKVSLLFYFLFFLLYILSESKKRIHGFWCTFKSNNSYSIVTAWNRIECMSNTPWLENENNFSLSYSNKRNATKSSRTTYFITEATAYTNTYEQNSKCRTVAKTGILRSGLWAAVDKVGSDNLHFVDDWNAGLITENLGFARRNGLLQSNIVAGVISSQQR